MKYINKSDKGLMIPYRAEGDKYTDHIAVHPGQVKELPESAEKHAVTMGLVLATKEEIKAQDKKDSEEEIVEEAVKEVAAEKAKESKEKIQVYSESELVALKKKEQLDLIESYGSKKKPALEEGRVKLILELQGAK